MLCLSCTDMTMVNLGNGYYECQLCGGTFYFDPYDDEPGDDDDPSDGDNIQPDPDEMEQP